MFLSDQVGVAATSDGRLFRTVDGASSWALVGSNARPVRSMTFLDPQHGVAVGDGGLFLTTADGGVTWTAKDLGAAPLNLSSVRA